MQVVIVEPYKNFKQKISLVKKYQSIKARIKIYNHYLYIEMEEIENE